MDESTYIVKAAGCEQISGYLGAEIHKRVEFGRGKAEKIGVWEYDIRCSYTTCKRSSSNTK